MVLHENQGAPGDTKDPAPARRWPGAIFNFILQVPTGEAVDALRVVHTAMHLYRSLANPEALKGSNVACRLTIASSAAQGPLYMSLRDDLSCCWSPGRFSGVPQSSVCCLVEDAERCWICLRSPATDSSLSLSSVLDTRSGTWHWKRWVKWSN